MSGATRLERGVCMPLRTLAAVLLATIAILGLGASTASAGPAVDLHELDWSVHVDLVDPGAGRDLAWWQGVVDDAIAAGNRLLEGRGGPFDTPCCSRLARSAPLSTFGSPGDGYDVIDSQAEQNVLAGLGSGSRVFLVDSASWCQGFSPGSLGCALRPGCSGDPNDDPSLWMYVTVDALDDGTLASVVAHERGHNSCLEHVAAAKCQLMQAVVYTPGLGGCMNAGECGAYAAGRTELSSGQECSCHDGTGGLLADGTACNEGTLGLCSGGVCGDLAGDARVRLVAAGSPGDVVGPPEDALRISGLTGDWSSLGLFAGTADDVRALAWAEDSSTLFGVVPTVFDDSVVTIDPQTGAILAWVGTIANGAQEIVSMAYDPGATSSPGDDRLIVLEVDGDAGEFRWIDPASPSTAYLLGALSWQPAGSFTGMAYDSRQGRLFLATPFGSSVQNLGGLWETDLSSCPPSPCTTTQLPGFQFYRGNASLAYSAETGMLYLVGDGFGDPDTRTFYDVIDPTTLTTAGTLSLDRFTTAGLAAVPEPGLGLGLGLGAFGMAGLARRRASCRGAGRGRAIARARGVHRATADGSGSGR